jgi:hypothetical protein
LKKAIAIIKKEEKEKATKPGDTKKKLEGLVKKKTPTTETKKPNVPKRKDAG